MIQSAWAYVDKMKESGCRKGPEGFTQSSSEQNAAGLLLHWSLNCPYSPGVVNSEMVVINNWLVELQVA
jgi:hypothetical protein